MYPAERHSHSGRPAISVEQAEHSAVLRIDDTKLAALMTTLTREPPAIDDVQFFLARGDELPAERNPTGYVWGHRMRQIRFWEVPCTLALGR